MIGELIPTGVTFEVGRNSINNAFSGTAFFNILSANTFIDSNSLLSASTGLNSIISNNGTGNLASGDFSFAGGSNNSLSAPYSVILAGNLNSITANSYANMSLTRVGAVIGGGRGNTAVVGFESAGVVAGGLNNVASGSYYVGSFIGNGRNNKATSFYSTILNGRNNLSSGFNTSILNGSLNTAKTSSATVLGGMQNLASGYFSLIGVGTQNLASGRYSFIGGGSLNSATTNYSSVINGRQNLASGLSSFIGGGTGNTVSATNSTIIGGVDNIINSNNTNSSIIGMTGFTATSANTVYMLNSYINGYLDLKPQNVLPPPSIGRIFFSGTPLNRLMQNTGGTSSSWCII